MLSNYFRYHFNFIIYLIGCLISVSGIKSGLFIFNIYNKVLGIKEVIKFSSKQDLFYYKNSNPVRYFNNLNQAFTVYRKGFKVRNKSLLQEYCLYDINFENGDIIIDVGANVGDLFFALTALDLQFLYIGFEPSPLENKALKLNIGQTNSVIYDFALGNINEDSTFYINSDYADSSLIFFQNANNSISVEQRTLDSISTPKLIKLLKIDVEGAEPEILLGSLETLKKVQYVSVDVSFERGVNKESTMVPTINLLLKQNFCLVSINFKRMVLLFENNTLSRYSEVSDFKKRS